MEIDLLCILYFQLLTVLLFYQQQQLQATCKLHPELSCNQYAVFVRLIVPQPKHLLLLLCALTWLREQHRQLQDRKSTRLNSSHVKISYAVFCLKKKINITNLNLSTTEASKE